MKNGSSVTLREITPEDAEVFLEFRKRFPHDSTHTMQYVGMEFPSLEETKKRLSAHFENKFMLNIGAFDDGKLVHYFNIRFPWEDHPWVKHVAQFGVMSLKDYWGLGIATETLRLGEEYAKSVGAYRIEAQVRAKMSAVFICTKNLGIRLKALERRPHSSMVNILTSIISQRF